LTCGDVLILSPGETKIDAASLAKLAAILYYSAFQATVTYDNADSLLVMHLNMSFDDSVVVSLGQRIANKKVDEVAFLKTLTASKMVAEAPSSPKQQVTLE
jgi:hypothetical protein